MWRISNLVDPQKTSSLLCLLRFCLGVVGNHRRPVHQSSIPTCVYKEGWCRDAIRMSLWLFWSAFTDDGAPIALVIIYILWVFLMRLFVIKRLMCKISVFIFNLKSLTQSLTGSFSTNELDSWEPKIPHSSAQCRKKSLTSSLSLCVSIF